jgi:hypothetical protein
MINNVYGGSEFLSVQTYASTPYINNSALSAGQVRFNSANRCMEVYDGNSWIMLASQAEVRLSSGAEEILRWGRQKMEEEQNWREMAEKNPTIKDAYEKFKQAEEQLKIVQALVKEDNVAG